MTTTVVTPKFARIALKMAHHAPALLPFLPMFRVAAEAAGLEYADYQERPKLRYHGRVIITAWDGKLVSFHRWGASQPLLAFPIAPLQSRLQRADYDSIEQVLHDHMLRLVAALKRTRAAGRRGA